MDKSKLKLFWEQVQKDQGVVPTDLQTLKDLSEGWDDIAWLGEELACVRVARNRAMESGDWGKVNRLGRMVEDLVADLEDRGHKSLAWFVQRAHLGGLTQRSDSKEPFEHAWERFQAHTEERENAHANYFGRSER